MEQKNHSPLCLLPDSQALVFHGCADLHFPSRALRPGWQVGSFEVTWTQRVPLSRCGLHVVASAFCGNKGYVVHLPGAEGQPLGVHWPSQLQSGATVGGAVIGGAVTVSTAGSRQEEAMEVWATLLPLS